jgi:hypothetical protein
VQRRAAARGLVSVALIAAAFWGSDWRVRAADHFDPPARTDPLVAATPDRAADIADIYTWQTGDNVVIVLTFAGPAGANLPATYDPDVLYTINISNTDFPTDAEIQIRFKFGKDGQNFGVEIDGLPDGGGPLIGPVEQTLSRNGILARAGLYDDPFFFDLQGFKDSKATGRLSIRNDRNFFDGQNDTAMVLQIPTAMLNKGQVLNMWATTARFAGQLH